MVVEAQQQEGLGASRAAPRAPPRRRPAGRPIAVGSSSRRRNAARARSSSASGKPPGEGNPFSTSSTPRRSMLPRSLWAHQSRATWPATPASRVSGGAVAGQAIRQHLLSL